MSYKKATGFAANIVNPSGSRGFRWRDTYSSDWTAALTLHTVVPYNQSTGNAGTYSTVPAGNAYAFLFRDCLRAAVIFQANKTGATYRYDFNFYDPVQAVGPVTYMPVLARAGEEQNVDFLNFPDHWTTNSAYFHPHGLKLYPGAANGRRYVWLDTNAIISFTQSNADTGASISAFIWNGQSSSEVVGVTFATGTTQTITAAQPGYYAYTYNVGTYNSLMQLSGFITGSGDSFGHQAVPYADNHLADLIRVRVLAASILCSNSASALNREGMVYCAQYQTTKAWYQNLSQQSLATARSSYVGPLEKGCYSYLKPSSSLDFEFFGNVTTSGLLVTSSCFDLGNTKEYLVVSPTTAEVGSVYPGLDLFLTYAWAIEFVTEDQFYEAELPMCRITEVQTAMEEIAAMPQFYENITHLVALGAMLARGAAFLARNAASFGNIIQNAYLGASGSPALPAQPSVVKHIVTRRISRARNSSQRRPQRQRSRSKPRARVPPPPPAKQGGLAKFLATPQGKARLAQDSGKGQRRSRSRTPRR